MGEVGRSWRHQGGVPWERNRKREAERAAGRRGQEQRVQEPEAPGAEQCEPLLQMGKLRCREKEGLASHTVS